VIRFILTLSSVAIVITAAAWSLVKSEWMLTALPSFFYETVIFLLFGTCTVFVYLFKFPKPDLFVQLYLLTMAIKLLAYGAYNFFIVIEDRDQAVQNVAWFMILYTVFTAIEIAFLYRKISRT
jgi:hypothetical protein